MSTSASSTERWCSCPASEALQHSKGEAGAPARRGKAIHYFLERRLTTGDRGLALLALEQYVGDEPQEVALELMAACATIDLDELPVDPKLYSGEMWLAWHPGPTDEAHVFAGDEAALLRFTGTESRQQATARLDFLGYFFGAADVAAVDQEGGTGLIVDYKTGAAYQKGPRESWQLKGLALALARAWDLESVDARMIRIGGEEPPRTFRHVFGKEELEATEQAISAGLARVQASRAAVARGALPTVYQGEWCRFCPAFSACPGKTALVRVLAMAPETIEAELRALLTPENTGVAHLKLKPIEELAARCRAAVKEAAFEFGGAPLPDGRIYGPVSIEKTEYDVSPAGEKALHELGYGPYFAEDVIERRITGASIDTAVDAYVAKRKVELEAAGRSDRPPTKKSVKEAVVRALEKVGDVHQKTEIQVREHR